ncbi:MAG: hypothetical protein HOO99_03855 [Hyphomicrobiaceae bacterium]|nr:hypothetical protein [Hyphomicrobiaceae bacterium]
MLAIPPQVLAIIDRCKIATMVQYDFPSGSVGLWNWHYSLSHGGVIFGPAPGSILLEEIHGTTQLDSDAVTLKLGALLNEAMDIIASTDWHQAPVTLYRAWLDDHDVLIHVEPFYSGFLDAAPITDASDEAFVIDQSIENSNRELSRVNGRMRSNPDQRTVSSNDGSLRYTGKSVTTEVPWGRNGSRYPT